MTDEQLAEEKKRVHGLESRENELHTMGIHLVGGIDEAGRGPLVGPVVAACVILPDDFFVPYLNDSKKVTEKRRENMFPQIINGAVSVGVGLASPAEIDEINILNATYLAMKRAVRAMDKKPEYVLNDAVHIPGLGIEQESIVKGDAKVAAISAASVIAKVSRDHVMRVYDSIAPEYGFARHKGYPTRAHYEAIERYGVLPIYRTSYLTKRIEAGTLHVRKRKLGMPDPFSLMEDFLKEYGLVVVR